MPVITYSVLRLGLFALALVGLWLVGMGGWLLVLVAAVVAWALSYVLLGSRRDAAAVWIAHRRAATRPRFSPALEADAAAEDAAARGAAAQDVAAQDVADPEADGPQSARPRPSSTP